MTEWLVDWSCGGCLVTAKLFLFIPVGLIPAGEFFAHFMTVSTSTTAAGPWFWNGTLSWRTSVSQTKTSLHLPKQFPYFRYIIGQETKAFFL